MIWILKGLGKVFICLILLFYMPMITDESKRLAGLAAQERRRQTEAKQELFFYRNRDAIVKHGLEEGHFPYDMTLRCLHSKSPLKKCPFDHKPLKRTSGAIRGTDLRDRALYYCSTCETNFYQPLTRSDQKRVDKINRETHYADVDS